MNRHVHHAAALRAVLGAIGTARIHIALEESVVSRIGIDQATDRAVFERHLGLDAAPAGAITRQHDLALDADVHLLQALEVRGHAVVHIHDFSGHVAVAGVGVVEGRLIAGVRIFRQHRFLDPQRELFRRHQFNGGLERPRHHGLELLDARVEAKRLELGERVIGNALGRWLACHVRVARHRLHVFLEARRVRHLAELLFALPLRRHGVIRETRESDGSAHGAAQSAARTSVQDDSGAIRVIGSSICG